ncbi:MAG: ABC transporter ATP-binding protein [Patescibacteria group bacterium]
MTERKFQTTGGFDKIKAEWPTLKKTASRIYVLYRKFMFAFVITVLLSLAVQGVLLTVPYLLKMIIDGLHQGASIDHLAFLTCIAAGVYTLEVPLELLLAINRNKYIDVKTKIHLAVSTITRMLGFSLGQIGSENSGLRQTTIGKGESAIHEMVGTFTKDLVPSVVKIVFTIIAFLVVCPQVGLLSMCFVLVYAGASLVLDLSMLPKLKKCRALDKVVDAEHAELLANLDLVIMQAEEERTVAEFLKRYGDYQRLEEALWLSYYKSVSWLRDPIAKLGFFLIVLQTIYLIRAGQYSVGQLVITSSWSLALFTSVGSLAPIQRRCMRNYSLVVRYFEMLDQPPDVVPPKHGVTSVRFQGDIEFKNVSYAHPASDGSGEILALRGISLCIKAGQTIGVVGRSGGGKSTLIKALLRWFDPDEGEILMDGINLREYDLLRYRRRIGYVPQQVRLWDTTIRRNISFGCDRELSDSELERLAKMVGIDRFYDRLGKKRFDSTVGELGRHLSGGQAQLIGIARALAKDPALLIFDEATSNLDNASEALVQHAMQTALAGRMGVVIAHRLSTVRNLDTLVVMKRGQIVGVGTHEKLSGSCAHYQKLISLEFRA